MHPILLRFGPVTIYSFGVFLALSVAVSSFIVWKKARQKALSDEKIIDIYVLSLTSFVIFGRALYVFANRNIFEADFGRVFLFLKYPGLSMAGGVAALILTVAGLSVLNGFRVFLLLDIFTAAFSVSALFWTAGCYLDGCLTSANDSTYALLAICFGLSAGLLWFISWRVRKSPQFSTRLHKKPGLSFLSYLQFASICFLILSITKTKTDFRPFLMLAVFGFAVFILKYREEIRMIKFPNEVLKQIKKYLEDRRREIEKKLSQMKKEDPFEDKTRLLDRASDDSEAQSKAGHERVAAMMHQLSMALVQTRKALTKIKIGKYGICENCGKMIDTDRLAAMPTAVLCVSCEKKKERR